jgi:hypothetical protein
LSIAYIRFPLGFPPASVDTRPEDIPREPLLERLLARAETAVRYADWRDDAWQLLQAPSTARCPAPDAPHAGPRPAAGPVALIAAQGGSAQGYACVASPLHYVAGMTNVHLPDGGLLRLAAAEALALAQDFARVFADGGQRLIAGADGTLCCQFDREIDAVTRDPQGVVGRDIGQHLPQGRDGPRLRRLMSEIEMWLFEHPVNRARAARQEVPITGLWLWEGGLALVSLPPLPATVVGRDVLFSAWSHERPVAERGSVLVLAEASPGTTAWREFESARLLRLLSELRAGRLSRLELSAGDRRYSLGAHWHWRFWRRPRPWREFFA